jgi:23S rRNA (guanosine2251-2'-O)-methyltransferase
MPCALVIGSEGNGVSKLVRDTVDGIISIPQKGKINSLNASNAAAVLLCEVCRQRG